MLLASQPRIGQHPVHQMQPLLLAAASNPGFHVEKLRAQALISVENMNERY